jgi:hypothetical protein
MAGFESQTDAQSGSILVIVTEIVLHHALWTPHLLHFSGPVIDAARTMPGNRHASVKPVSMRTWLTLTCWDSEADMRAFVRCDEHIVAMRQTSRLAESTRFKRIWWQGSADEIGWGQAQSWLHDADSTA